MPNVFDLRLDSLLGLENDVASHVINAAENVEVLQLVFKRSELVQLMEPLSKSELGTLDVLKIWIQVDTEARAIGDADMQPLINYACRTPWNTVFCVYTDIEYWTGTVADSHVQVSHGFKEVPSTTESESLPEL
ncbi:hypothetical protein FRC05_001129 [Tulasnella sp. 425]|nr:hypothetical protein FRC05_001129 [Tulasnella sp. 425]